MSKGVHNIAFYVSPDPECSRTTQNLEISIAPSRGHILYAIYGNHTCVISHIVVTAIDKKYRNYYVSTDEARGETTKPHTDNHEAPPTDNHEAPPTDNHETLPTDDHKALPSDNDEAPCEYNHKAKTVRPHSPCTAMTRPHTETQCVQGDNANILVSTLA